MAHETHGGHTHQHGPGCGHTAVMHEGHADYLHDGHLHHPQQDHVDEHRVAVNARNPEGCTRGASAGHAAEHRHGRSCGHEMVPHGEHEDYLVGGRLHHQHGDHCDDHGPLEMA